MKKSLKYFLLSFACILLIYIFVFYFSFPRRNEERLKRSHEKKIKHQESLIEHAKIKTYLKKYSEAEEIYIQLLKESPNSKELKVNLATLLFFEKKYPEAIELLNSIPQKEITPQVTLLFAQIYLARKEYADSEKYFRKYLEVLPDDQEAILSLAQLLSWNKKYEEAIHLYEKALSQDSKNVEIRREYAIVLIWMGKHEEGARELKKTLDDYSND